MQYLIKPTKITMKKTMTVMLAMAACTLAPAYGQEEFDSKRCYRRCLELVTAEGMKKVDYDYEAVNNDASKTEAEKKKSHKQAVAGVCKKTCTPE